MSNDPFDVDPYTWEPPHGTPGWAEAIVRRCLADIAAGKQFNRSFDPADYFECPAPDLGAPDKWQDDGDAWERELDGRWP